jgi:copper(I)-binding protein
MKSPFLILMACLLPFAAQAEIRVTDGYVRAANPKSGAAFMTIRNTGDTACTLSGVSTDAAARAELHTSREENGMMRMVKADPITIAPGQSHVLARGGDHVMLMGLHEPLADGRDLLLMLDLGDCGLLSVPLPVDNARKPGATGGMSGHDGHAGHTGHGAMSPQIQP